MLTESFQVIEQLFKQGKVKEIKITENRIKVIWISGNKITTYLLSEDGVIELLQNHETFK